MHLIFFQYSTAATEDGGWVLCLCNTSDCHGTQFVSPSGRVVAAVQLSLLSTCARSWSTACGRLENNHYHQLGLSIQSSAAFAMADPTCQGPFSGFVVKFTFKIWKIG